MTQTIFIGNFPQGLTTNRLPFYIDNSAFPTLWNFYIWRGRARKKRGTVLLGQLTVQVEMAAMPNAWQYPPITMASGTGNLITGTNPPLEDTATLVPKTISLVIGSNTYTDPQGNGILTGTPSGTGTINYASGEVTVSDTISTSATGKFSFYPGLPVMGLEDYNESVTISSPDQSNPYPLLIAFDTTYAYQIFQGTMTSYFFNVGYYKYTSNPVYWNGMDYMQFWSTNYSGAFWATNNNPGFHFLNGTYTSGSGTTTITFNFKLQGENFITLVIGDQLFFNEWNASMTTINGLVGEVTDIRGAASGNYVVTFTTSPVVSGTGIVQLLTNSIAGQDGIRWYDGDQTASSGLPKNTLTGWCNFAPPLSDSGGTSIDSLPGAVYYLVGALMIVPFKDRLLFFGVWVQTSSGSTPQYLQDTVVWSQNGTPFYANSPANQTSQFNAYYTNVTGKGGWRSAGISSPIVTLTNNEDVLLVGFTNRQTRFIYTGTGINPFLFFNINSELGSAATFSGVTLDQGGLSIGTYGIAMTDQQSAQRIDLNIPDQVFTINPGTDNFGMKRVSAARDYYREWIYFSYPSNSSDWNYPTQTFMYNYRDQTWAIFYESFTCHGNFRRSTNVTWGTLPFATWGDWNESWGSSTQTSQFPSIIAGNTQGFVLIKGEGTGEAQCCSITDISANLGNLQLFSTNHCLSVGDYIYIQGTIGSWSSTTATITGITLGYQTTLTCSNTFVVGQFVMITGIVGTTQLNNNSYKVSQANPNFIVIEVNSLSFSLYVSGGTVSTTLNNAIARVSSIQSASEFTVDIPAVTGTYVGNGTFAKLCQPLLQTKEFNPYWEQGKKTRMGVQKYLFDRTATSSCTVNIYLNQDPYTIYNSDPIYPSDEAPNDGVIYSQIVYTCPESTNLGLTPANTNLQMPGAATQKQIWHRMNTSLIGDTVQLGITLSDAQMRNYTDATAELTLHAMQFSVTPSQSLS